MFCSTFENNTCIDTRSYVLIAFKNPPAGAGVLVFLGRVAKDAQVTYFLADYFDAMHGDMIIQ